MRRSAAVILACAALAAAAGGCFNGADRATGTVAHYAAPLDRLTAPRRVALLALANASDCPCVVQPMTEELYRAIQGRRAFHVRVVPLPSGCSRPAASDAAPDGRARGCGLTLRQIADLRRDLGADAALLGSVTHFHPYPQLQIGLYLQLVDLRDGKLLWGVDHVWDAGDRDTCDRIRAWHKRDVGCEGDADQWHLATMSPRRFKQFVAWEVARTLPDPTEAKVAARTGP